MLKIKQTTIGSEDDVNTRIKLKCAYIIAEWIIGIIKSISIQTGYEVKFDSFTLIFNGVPSIFKITEE